MRNSIRLGVAVLASLLGVGTIQAQDVVDQTYVGDWSGAIHIMGTELKIVTHFTSTGATIDIPQQMAIGIPLQNVSAVGDSVYFELPAGPGLALFKGTLDDGTVKGSFEQSGMKGTFDLARGESDGDDVAVVDEAVPGESVSIDVEGGRVVGTLLIPDTDLPVPIVILVAGSGPTDRDGNTVGAPGKNNSLRLLAEALVERNIATLRYDKRGLAESVVAVSESDLRIDSFAVDVESWVRFVTVDDRFSRVVLAGHSEGALLVSLAAKAVSVEGVITIAGAGRLAQDVLHEQLATQLPAQMLQEADDVMAKLANGETTAEYPQALTSLFRPSIQPYLISWFARDPAEVLGEVSAPKLIVQGDTDIQVMVTDADRLKAFSEEATQLIIPGMNHVLKEVSSDRGQQLASYTDPNLPIAPALVQAIVQFVESLGR